MTLNMPIDTPDLPDKSQRIALAFFFGFFGSRWGTKKHQKNMVLSGG